MSFISFFLFSGQLLITHILCSSRGFAVTLCQLSFGPAEKKQNEALGNQEMLDAVVVVGC